MHAATSRPCSIRPRSRSSERRTTRTRSAAGHSSTCRRFGYRGEGLSDQPQAQPRRRATSLSLASRISRGPEVAIIAVPGDAALAAVDECAEHGVK